MLIHYFFDIFQHPSLNNNKKKDADIERIRLSIFGTVPWNVKGFIPELYSLYARNAGVFSLSRQKETNYHYYDLKNGIDTDDSNQGQCKQVLMPEFYFYVPEILLARLRADTSLEYEPFRCRLSVISRLLSHVEVLDEQKCDYFFPYAITSKKLLLKKNTFKLDHTKMHLIHIKFHEDRWPEGKPGLMADCVSGRVRNKRLFTLFINHLFIRPTDILRVSLNSLCKNVDFVCKEISLNGYAPVNKTSTYNLLKLYDYLLDNKEQSMLYNLTNLYDLAQPVELNLSETDAKMPEFSSAIVQAHNKVKISRKLAEEQRKLELSTLKSLNTNFSGQFLIPASVANETTPHSTPKHDELPTKMPVNTTSSKMYMEKENSSETNRPPVSQVESTFSGVEEKEDEHGEGLVQHKAVVKNYC